MRVEAKNVGFVVCRNYERRLIGAAVEELLAALAIRISRGSRVLLKPNLVAARYHDGLACTHPEMIAAVAEWCLDQGATVAVGDSPAFGTARGVMATHGIESALRGLPVRLINFDRPRKIRLAGGVTVGVAGQIFDCDTMINLPRVKVHDQLYVSLAVKNYFGVVNGFRKAWFHARYGEVGRRFEELIVDLLAVLPDGFSIVDGIVAMQRHGPIKGVPYQLGVVAASANPVALDTAILCLLDLPADRSPLWRECRHRDLVGCNAAELVFPLLRPQELRAEGFCAPESLTPVSFHPGRLMISGLKRFVSRRGDRSEPAAGSGPPELRPR